MRHIRLLTHAWALSCVLLPAVGCQTYEPRPLDLAAHADAWSKRSPLSEEVRVLADRLADGTPRGALTFDPTDGVSLAEGEVIGLVFNSSLRIARLQAGVAKATAEHAGLWSDPELSIDLLRITESVPDPWVIGSAISFTVPLSGRLGAEKARAEAAKHVALDSIVEAEWKLRRDLRDLWLRWSSLRLEAEQTRDVVGSLAVIVESMSKLVDAGEVIKTEAALFAIKQADQLARLNQLEGEVAEAEQEIRSLLGLSPAAEIQLLPRLAVIPVTAGQVRLEDGNLTLARLRREYELAEHGLKLEIRKQYPDLAIGPQYESDEGQSRVGFVAGIPLPILNANKGGIAEATARREVARAVFETGYEQVVGRLARLRARRKALSSQRQALI